MVPTARRALARYGGEDRWRRATAVESELSAWGWAFRLRGRSPMRGIRARADLRRPEIRLTPFGRSDRVAVLEGHDVRIEDLDGAILKRRANARSHFPSLRRRLYWDDLDQAYFAGYALWNYLTLPALLMSREIEWTELSPGRVEGIFPPHIPTHSRIQRFEFDLETSLLRQHDYTAEILGRNAFAAHRVLEHADNVGTPYPSRRRVTPRSRDGTPRRGPTLVAIEVHDWRLCDDS
jgi:hypothetical protein